MKMNFYVKMALYSAFVLLFGGALNWGLLLFGRMVIPMAPWYAQYGVGFTAYWVISILDTKSGIKLLYRMNSQLAMFGFWLMYGDEPLFKPTNVKKTVNEDGHNVFEISFDKGDKDDKPSK